MKNIIIVLVIAVLAFMGYLFVLNKEPLDKVASEAEMRGDYDSAISVYARALLEVTEAKALPDKNKPNVSVGDEWLQEIKEYIAWVSYRKPHGNMEVHNLLEGIIRCTSSVANHNFITEKEPIDLVKDSLNKEWREPFVHSEDNNEDKHLALLSKVMDDSLSLFRIRAMNGFIYHGKLLNLKTGKRTDFTLYPNSTVTLLVQPGNYFLICSSEVQFTEGLSGKSWKSPENIIPITGPARTTLYRATLKSRVSRKKK